MNRSRWLLVLVLALMPFAACTKGDECDRCETDSDCTQGGTVCTVFSDGSKRCGSGVGGTNCRVP